MYRMQRCSFFGGHTYQCHSLQLNVQSIYFHYFFVVVVVVTLMEAVSWNVIALTRLKMFTKMFCFWMQFSVM